MPWHTFVGTGPNMKNIKRLTPRRVSSELQRMHLPSDERIASLCTVLKTQIEKEKTQEKYAPVKHVLTLVGVGAVLGLSLLSPSAALLAKPFLDEKRRRENEEWKHYNPYYLRRTIERLKKQKYVEIEERNGEQVITLTKNGKKRILKYALDSLVIDKPKHWDSRWRLVLYDVDSKKKHLRDIFRGTLRSLGFYQLQESVWLYPYPCEEQTSFLREYYDVGSEVIYVVATKLEDDSPYRTYFGLD